MVVLRTISLKQKTNKKTIKAPSKPVPRNRKRHASSKLEDEKPDKKKKRGSGGHGGEPDQNSQRYHPVDVEWQRNACNVMGVQFHGPNTVAPGGPDVAIKPPDARIVKHIRGDGNCLFRSFSYLIAGSEDEHDAVRPAIVSHMLTIGHFLVGFQIPTQSTVQGYLNDTHMDREGSWGTEVEMLTLAHFLQTPVLVYNTEHEGWSRYSPRNVDVTEVPKQRTAY